jgi:hypothetical protein
MEAALQIRVIGSIKNSPADFLLTAELNPSITMYKIRQ